MNEITYSEVNEMRFPISFGMFPDSLLFDKYLKNLANEINESKKYEMDIFLICLFE